MEYFKNYFKNTDFDAPSTNGEIKVVCPFHDDSDPSMHINVEDSVYNCFVCGRGGDEVDFISRIEEISLRDARSLYAELESAPYSEWDMIEHADLLVDEDFKAKVYKLGFTDKTIKELQLGISMVQMTKTLGFPVFFRGALVDIRRYNIDNPRLPKLLANPSGKPKNGYVIPYDVWLENDQTITYIFEGEKDMAIAREHGLNAITLTGGAKALPNKFVINSFKDKKVVICYDNDDAGRAGAQKLGEFLASRVESVATVNIGELVQEDKGDFHDFIHRDGGSLFSFFGLKQSPIIIEEKKQEKLTLGYVFDNNIIGKKLVSDVTVTGEFADVYKIDSFVQVRKEHMGNNPNKGNDMAIDDVRYWELNEGNMGDILGLIEVDAKDAQVIGKQLNLLGLTKDEEGLKWTKREPITVHKSYVIDSNLAISEDDEGTTTPIELYTTTQLKVGNQYEIDYQLYSHPTRNQKIVAIATKVIAIGDNKDFKVDKELMELLPLEETLDEKVNILFESARHYVAKHMNFDIWFATDLVFNSILDFDFDGLKRGTLDLFILGDTQTGKSETTSSLVELYKFGHFLSLKNATTVGLIGGSNKVEGSYLNTIGALPRQHRKLVVMEEFSGAKPDFIKAMTDIRSSNVVRIARASGELVAPCKLRMITISNPHGSDDGFARALNSFPSAVEPITSLVNNTEDITRYDAFVLAPKSDYRKNPFENRLKGTPIPREVYEHKIKWVETRKVENVIYEDNVQSYIWHKAQDLNNLFESDFSLFGVTTPIKLARFSIALANLVFNTDKSMENVIITEEIVDYMYNWLIKIYTQDLFRLDEYKKERDSYNNYTQEDLAELQDIYNSNTALIDYLSNESSTTRSNMQAISGESQDNFSPIFEALVGMKAITVTSWKTSPTQKFRKMYRKLERTPINMAKKHDRNKSKVTVDLKIKEASK